MVVDKIVGVTRVVVVVFFVGVVNLFRQRFEIVVHLVRHGCIVVEVIRGSSVVVVVVVDVVVSSSVVVDGISVVVVVAESLHLYN